MFNLIDLILVHDICVAQGEVLYFNSVPHLIFMLNPVTVHVT